MCVEWAIRKIRGSRVLRPLGLAEQICCESALEICRGAWNACTCDRQQYCYRLQQLRDASAAARSKHVLDAHAALARSQHRLLREIGRLGSLSERECVEAQQRSNRFWETLPRARELAFG